MTKFRIASDFHMEFYGTYREPYSLNGRDLHECIFLPVMEGEKEQILLLAGDLFNATKPGNADIVLEKLCARFKYVVTIAGNHEFYQDNFVKTIPRLRRFYDEVQNKYGIDNLTFLEKESIVFDDVTIFGATLWTNFDGSDPNAMLFAPNAMSDFAGIITNGSEGPYSRRFTPLDSVREFEETFHYLDMWFKNADPNMKKIVMSHHAPSLRSTAQRFKGSMLNAAFRSDLDYYIEDRKPNLWIHGHMHDASDYMINDTRVICNPYGYHNERVEQSYNPKLVVEL